MGRLLGGMFAALLAVTGCGVEVIDGTALDDSSEAAGGDAGGLVADGGAGGQGGEVADGGFGGVGGAQIECRDFPAECETDDDCGGIECGVCGDWPGNGGPMTCLACPGPAECDQV